MGRGVVESGKFRTERVGLELRTTDPASTQEGEAWIRTDIAPNTDQLATLRFDGGANTFEVPIFDSAASVTYVKKVWRIPIGGTIGFIPLAAAGEPGAFPQVKYQHGGNALDAHDSLEVNVIPDTSMFQSPIYQWNAQAGIGVADGQEATSWDDQLASLTASSVGNPFYRANQGGFEAVEYDGADDGHDFPSDGQLPTGDSAVSFAATLWAKSQHTGSVVTFGDATDQETAELELRSDGVVRAVTFGTPIAETTATYSTGQWITVGGRLSSSEFAAFLNGGNKGTTSGTTLNLTDSNRSFGYLAHANDKFGDLYLNDLVVCAAAESDQAFSDYHNDRLG